ncbi:beta-1,4 N-acetylgalactosaminyltransferase 1-like [Ptychodera flava]|uniref:beta-1,4 N-acetylgalactosaminyltransferase 1-like n=1 Tax=Ptychodera flava TaxID=63121 RepID=UPI00396A622A
MATSRTLVIPIIMIGLLVICAVYLFKSSSRKGMIDSTKSKEIVMPWKRLPYDASFTKEVSKLRHKMSTQGTSCSCMTLQTIGNFFGPLDGSLKERRKIELQKWSYDQAIVEEPMVFCRALSPLSYIGGGIHLEPLRSIRVVGISLHSVLDDVSEVSNSHHEITITSTKKFGVLMIENVNTTYISFYGNGTHEIKMLGNCKVDFVNAVLQNLIYVNTYYDINIRDLLEVKYFTYNVNIDVHIRRQPRPKIYNTNVIDDITKKVTIVTKTFERYNCIFRLIESVHKFYPGMTILVADDSENPQNIDNPNVQQFIMPFSEGWFPGRNLLLSQVRTKFFLWVDDDYVFTENTILENFLEKLEDPAVNLDIVGAFFQSEDGYKHIQTRFYKSIELDPGDEGGDCLRRFGTSHRTLEEYPQCMVVDMVTNFFMAKTLAVRAVGFDPFFKRIGHMEFFLDGFGSLRVATCKDVFIIHKRDNANNKKYVSFRNRQNDEGDRERNIQRTLFKNNLQCFRI